MLSFELPAFEIAGVTVFRDHAVASQFYYAAPHPALARSGGRAMFDLMAYSVDLRHSVLAGTTIPDELGAGFLTMGSECLLSAAQLSALRGELAGRAGLPQEQVSLAGIPYHKGSVRVIALDQMTTPADSTTDPASASPTKGRPTFVERLLGSGQPALLGDLRSIFSLSLSQEGVAFLKGLYEDRAAPVGVVYDLKFYGLRPAVEAVVHANLSRVFEHFGGSLGVGYAWAKAEVKAGIDHLVETGDIQIELTSQAVGDEAQRSKELALSLFRDRIVQEMFRPVPQTTLPLPTGLPGGLGSAGTTTGVNLTLDLKRSYEDKQVTYSFRERAPEERTHAPQSFLKVLLSPAELAQHIHQISLDDPFFELLDVLVTGPTREEMQTLGLRQIAVRLRYGEPGAQPPPDTAELIFRPESTGDKTFAVKRRGRRSLTYHAALTYEFMPQSGTDGDALRYDLPERVGTGRSLLLNPYADFGVLNVEVEAGRLPPDTQEVDVHLTYPASADRASAFQADQHVRLTPGPDAAPRRWQVRTQDTGLQPYGVQATFAFTDGGTYTTPLQARQDPLLRLDSPFTAQRQLLIKPVLASDQITQITVELDYHDEAGNYRRTRLVELHPPFASVTQSWPVLSPDRQTVRTRVTVHESGLLTEGDWEATDEPSLIVGSAAHRVGRVDIRLIGPALADVGLDALQIKVQLLPAAGPPTDDPQSVLLQGADTQATVSLNLAPGQPLHYRFQTTAFKSDGSTREAAWKDMTASPLILSTRTL
ncbi:hypothetical protein GO986_06735 [Deinococcus sp. HMF7620]|uniref:Uncharacterized protein n=1 Tax=Deinococcus arboris TaxID=2682977 RepID=A0A7C9LK79_9DEIO|nr:hypothetical protein [Deinococcus arboris]MVN86458.1 hypothetical protein [Deinococcus arboris]